MESFEDYAANQSEKKYPSLKKGMELTDEWKNAYDKLEYTNENFFLTGLAGTGKSSFVKYWLSNTEKRVAVLAPTGIAAVNLFPIKATTIHRFFGFPPKPLTDNNIPILSENVYDYGKKSKMYNSIDCILIDEISMVSSLMLEAIHRFYVLNYGATDPFNGIQMVFVGDMNQLPPVVVDDAEIQHIKHNFGSNYFFDSKALKESQFSIIHFSKIFRQKDPVFTDYLNKIREATITDDELEMFNRRLCDNRVDDPVIICGTNRMVQFINEKRLESIDAPLIKLRGEMEGNFNIKNCPVEEEILVKKGAKIMMLINDSDDKYSNGTIGEFVSHNKDYCVVRINDKNVVIEPYTFQQYDSVYDKDKGIDMKPKASFKAYPIRLSWAMSAHKSQGQTLERVIINTGQGFWAHGQAYLSLSRATNMDNLRLEQPITKNDIVIDPVITGWFKEMREQGKIL